MSLIMRKTLCLTPSQPTLPSRLVQSLSLDANAVWKLKHKTLLCIGFYPSAYEATGRVT